MEGADMRSYPHDMEQCGYGECNNEPAENKLCNDDCFLFITHD